jgi:hypothetical protein
MARLTPRCRSRATKLTHQAHSLHQALKKVMRCCGRQCRGHGHVVVQLVRHTAHQLLELGEPITALGQHAQPLRAQATGLSAATRERCAEAFKAAMHSHAHIRQPSKRLTQGQKLRHGKLVHADDLTIAPILKGQRHGPAQFGRQPGIVSDPATGFLFATRVPEGNPRDPSSVLPRLDQVQKAIARVKTPPRPRVHSVAGDLGIHDTTLRQALHARGILTVGIPKTVEPITPHPSPEQVLAILNEAGLHRQRTPHQVHLACACG